MESLSPPPGERDHRRLEAMRFQSRVDWLVQEEPQELSLMGKNMKD